MKFRGVSVKNVTSDSIVFENGIVMDAVHQQDCCEDHYLDFSNLHLQDFDGLKFNLTGEDFLERVPGYGIRLVPTNGHPISIPGYGSNNGFYSSNITLRLRSHEYDVSIDVSECQEVEGE